MPEFKCLKTCHAAGRLYKEGEIVEAETPPCSHFALESGSVAEDKPEIKPEDKVKVAKIKNFGEAANA
jgi:hypothetical protein